MTTNLKTTFVGSLLAAAAVWPTLLCALAELTASPYERALASAWCGAAPHARVELLGHCPACWLGSAMLVVAAILLSRAPAVRARSLGHCAV